jgi:hypothetical protein
MSTNKKVITLDHIQCIKEYIDGTTNSSIRYAIDGELKSYINEELAAAANYIQSDYDKKHTELSNRLQYVEQHGSEEELNALKLQLDALNADTENKFNALSALETQLNQLSGDVEALEAGVSSGSVFSAGQLDEIINTALINKTKISDDMVEAPNVYTQNLVALIGKFGQINAANIIGDDISGHTIRSSSTYNGKPVWQLNHLGEGWLAKENIKWDSEGNVTFGPDVKISFNNVTDVEDKLLEAVAGIDDNIKSYVNEAVASNANSSISLSQLNDAVSMLQGKVDEAKTSAETALTAAVETLNGTISTNATAQEALSASVNAINNWLGADYNVNHATLSAQLAAVETALATAQEENNAEMESALSDLQESLTTQLESLTTQYNETSAAVSTLQSSVSNLQNSALSGEDVTDLLSTAMIDSTSVSGQEIATPTLLAKKLVALVGKFSTIEASKISGTHIQGYTISSPLEKLDNNGNVMYATDENGQPIYETVKNVDGTDMVDENGQPIYVTEINDAGEEVPIRVKQMLDIKRDRDKIGWILNADGSGQLANGAIEWNTGGQLVFNPNYKIPAANIDNALISDINKLSPLGTKISADGIYTGTIQSHNTDEQGNTITPSWKLSESGEGHLAGGAISWLSDGHLLLSNGVSINGDVSINGQAIMSGIVNDSESVNSFSNLVANSIDAIDIRTNTLETKPGADTDKIHIEDNFIHCISNEGRKNVVISSNDISASGYLDTLLLPNRSYNRDKKGVKVSFNTETVYKGAMGWYTNSEPWQIASGDSIKLKYINDDDTETIKDATAGKIGFIFKGSSVSLNLSLMLITDKYNPNVPNTGIISRDYWEPCTSISINGPNKPVIGGWGSTITAAPDRSTYLVGVPEGNKIYYGSKLLVYRADTINGIYEPYIMKDVITNWWANNYDTYKCNISSFNIDDDGFYAIELYCIEGSLMYYPAGTSTSNLSLIGTVDATVNQNMPANYTEIGMNGLVMLSGNGEKSNFMSLNSDDIILISKAVTNNTLKFNGIKINDSGIYLGDGTTSWKKVDMGKLMDLGILSSN